jgi:hypothetical protein
MSNGFTEVERLGDVEDAENRNGSGMDQDKLKAQKNAI